MQNINTLLDAINGLPEAEKVELLARALFELPLNTRLAITNRIDGRNGLKAQQFFASSNRIY